MAGQWDRGKYLFQCASDIDTMIAGLKKNGFPPAAAGPTPAAPKPKKLPYFFVHGTKLAKIGPSHDGSTYQHNVIKEHFDMMIAKLAILAIKEKTFETPDFMKLCDVPKHEPLIVLTVLEEQKLLINVRRGRWVFANAPSFEADAKKVWDALPHHL